MEKKSICCLIIGILAILSLLLYLTYLVFKVTSYILTSYGACFIFMLLTIYIARYVVRALVFPGSSIFIRKMVEYNIRTSMTKIIMNTVCDFKYNLEDASQSETIDESTVDLLMDGVETMKKMIDSIITNNNRQLQLGTLTRDQEEFQRKIEDLKQAVVSIRLTKSEGNMINISLWDCDSNTTDFNIVVGCTFSDNLKSRINQLEEFCTYLGETMDVEDTTSIPKKESAKECTLYQKFKRKAYVYWSNTSFGHLDQVRVDLENSYKGEQEFVSMSDGGSIDTMWIENQSDDPEAPTVIFCNPNGVFYETFAYDGNWLEFYLEQGFNVFLWNYRGYGRSTGSLNPSCLFSDADELVKHLKNVRGVKKLLAHGISLGGGVACHLSNNPNIDVIFADRTFSSLDSVVRDDFGASLRSLYNLVTLNSWKMHCARKFLKSNKYKILSSDPKDDMIPELASLKNGVTRAVVTNSGLFNGIAPSSSKGQKPFYDLDTVLDQSQSETMFKILSEIFSLNLTKVNEMYAKAKNSSKSKKKKDDDFEKNQSIELNFLDEQDDKMANDDLFNMSGTNYSAHSESYLDRSTNNTKFESDKKTITDNHKEYATHLCIAMKDMSKLDEKDSLHKMLVKYYIPDDHERIEQVLVRVKRTLCRLDSAGLTFHNIFKAAKRTQHKLFKQFLVNLEIWGSYSNLNVYDQETFTMTVAKKNTENQLTTVFENMIEIIKEENTRNYPFLSLLLRKFGALGVFLSQIESHLLSKSGSFRQSPSNRTSQSTTNSSHKPKINKLGNGDMKDEDEEENMTLLESEDTDIQETNSLVEGSKGTYDIGEVTEHRVGYLIPLTCGHCGIFNSQEKTHYLNHLEASILKK